MLLGFCCLLLAMCFTGGGELQENLLCILTKQTVEGNKACILLPLLSLTLPGNS